MSTTVAIRTTWWPIRSTDLGRCQWIERGRRCRHAPTQYFEASDQPAPRRAQVVCDDHAAALEAGTLPQRWSAPEQGYVLCGRGLVFLTRPRPAPVPA